MDRSFSSPRIASSNISVGPSLAGVTGGAAGGPVRLRSEIRPELADRYIGTIYRSDISTETSFGRQPSYDGSCKSGDRQPSYDGSCNMAAMKRILLMVALGTTFLVALAVPAFAEYPPAGTTQTPEVLGKTLRAAPGTAFTGSTVIPLVIVAL